MMQNQTAAQPHDDDRFARQEWRPERFTTLAELPEGSIEPAIAMLERLKSQAASDPGMPWTFFACREDDADTCNILNLWACGLARVSTVFNRSDGSPACHIAR